MSSGATFTLVTNDGRMDQILTASNLLRGNINDYMARNQAAGKADINPTLPDLERSHVLHVNAHFKPYVAIALEYYKVSANNVTLGTNIQLSLPQYGDFIGDMVVNIKVSAPTTSFSGTAVDASDCVLFKHCDYPGERIIASTSMEVNSNPLDSYTNDLYVLHRQFRVGADKIAGWNRSMGQETPEVATYIVPATTSVTTAPNTARTKFAWYNGFQTYKQTHPGLDLWIPLLYWFNMDPRIAFPSVSVPYGQRFMNFTLNTVNNIYRAIINPAATSPLTNPVLSTPQVTSFDLYINNLFVLPEVHNIFIDRVAFTLISVHRRQTNPINQSSGSIHLVQLKWPITEMYIGFQPSANVTTNSSISQTGNQSSIVDPNMENWHRYGVVTDTLANAAALTSGAVTSYNLKTTSSHITTIKLVAHGITLFNEFPAAFYNQYIPFQYGGQLINTPTDPGLFMVSFCLYPGEFQPSGHFNASRAREFYLYYTSNLIDSSNTGVALVIANCRNFLLITEGSATIRYST